MRARTHARALVDVWGPRRKKREQGGGPLAETSRRTPCSRPPRTYMLLALVVKADVVMAYI